jgi:hypothetical protein
MGAEAPIWHGARSTFGGDQPCNFTGQVLPVVIVGVEDPHVLVPGELLHRPHIAPCEVESIRNCKVAETVRPHCETRLRAESAHDEIHRMDTYSLAGLGPALDAIAAECPML